MNILHVTYDIGGDKSRGRAFKLPDDLQEMSSNKEEFKYILEQILDDLAAKK